MGVSSGQGAPPPVPEEARLLPERLARVDEAAQRLLARGQSALTLGISRRGLYSKLQAYGEHVGSHEAPGPSESVEPQDPVDDVPVVTDEPGLEELGSARGDA